LPFSVNKFPLICDPIGVIYNSYVCWLNTQGEKVMNSDSSCKHDGLYDYENFMKEEHFLFFV